MKQQPTLVLRCGCTVAFNATTEKPRCPRHGEQSVVRAVGMPAPRIRGVATGPHVQTEDLAPSVAPLVEKS